MENNYRYCDNRTKIDVMNASGKMRLVEKPLGCRVFHDVVIVPSNAPEKYPKGELIVDCGTVVSHVNSNINYDTPQEYVVPESESELQTVVYLGTVNNCWGHYFTDGFSKLWWLLSEDYLALKQESSVKILVTVPYIPSAALPGSYKQLLHLLGIDEEIEVVKEWKRYCKVYVPDGSLFMENHHRVYTKEFRKTIDRLMSQVPQLDEKECRKYGKIYLSRAHWVHKNADFGEHNIERLFKRNGYAVLYPEQLPIEKQLAIYRAADSLVSTSGSIAHNAIFCHDGAELIVLSKDHATPDYQMVINQMRDLKVIWMTCHLSIFVTDMPNLGPFFMYVNEYVCRFAKDRFGVIISNGFNRKQYMKYVELCLKKEDFKMRIQPVSGLDDFFYEQLYREMGSSPSFARKIYDGLGKLGLDRVKESIKYLYCKVRRN